MGRRQNNPELVEYLKANGAKMSMIEFTVLYDSLSSNDKDRLDKEIREELESDDWSIDNPYVPLDDEDDDDEDED